MLAIMASMMLNVLVHKACHMLLEQIGIAAQTDGQHLELRSAPNSRCTVDPL